MKKIFLTAILLSSCKEQIQLRDVAKCGEICYTLGGTPGVGICKYGTWECADGGPPICTGQIGPYPDRCDGIDSSCIGITDLRHDRPCTTECGTGKESCIDGQYQGCTAPVLNGIEFCYEGPPDTVQNGLCHPGVKKCEDGKIVCENQVMPQPEICNGQDDSCDGITDDGVSEGKDTDFVFVIDNSGSMLGYINAMTAAMANFVKNYESRTDVRWAVVTAPGNGIAQTGTVSLYQNFSSASDAAGALNQQIASGGGNEPTIDAINLLCDPSNPLGMTWKATKRVIIMLSDEQPQSYLEPRKTIAETVALCDANNTSMLAFVVDVPQWHDLAKIKNSKMLPFQASTMESDLSKEIDKISCQ
jgi:hypothetical protein